MTPSWRPLWTALAAAIATQSLRLIASPSTSYSRSKRSRAGKLRLEPGISNTPLIGSISLPGRIRRRMSWFIIDSKRFVYLTGSCSTIKSSQLKMARSTRMTATTRTKSSTRLRNRTLLKFLTTIRLWRQKIAPLWWTTGWDLSLYTALRLWMLAAGPLPSPWYHSIVQRVTS